MIRALLFAVIITNTLLAQSEPGKLPASITGVATPITGIVAASGTASAPPMSRFQNLAVLPPETVGAVLGVKTGAEWLRQRQRPNGRFIPGINLAERKYIFDGSDVEQAYTTWALAAAARFTGDEKLALAAGQAVLSLLTLTELKSDGSRVPSLLSSHRENNAIEFAAALVLAIHAMPTIDDKLRTQADELCAGLVQRLFTLNDPASCLAWEAVAIHSRRSKRTTHADKWLEHASQSRMELAKGTNLLAAVFCTNTVEAMSSWSKSVESVQMTEATFACADLIVAKQASANTHRDSNLAGGIVWTTTAPIVEPNWTTAPAVRALAAACERSRRMGDRARYSRYRSATANGLDFLRRMQFAADTPATIDEQMKKALAIGGQRNDWNGNVITVNATAHAVLAYVRFLESGAEMRD